MLIRIITVLANVGSDNQATLSIPSFVINPFIAPGPLNINLIINKDKKPGIAYGIIKIPLHILVNFILLALTSRASINPPK